MYNKGKQMAVGVKDYLDSMKTVSSRVTVMDKPKNETDTKTQALLAQLIEAISYSNSVNFKQKTLNAPVPGSKNPDETGKQVLENMRAQEKLVQQLAHGQKLSNEQTKELNDTIDKLYELIGAQEINYKKFAANLEKFALQDLPEAVQTRLINDSRDAHMIGQEQKQGANPALQILKRIRNLLEDSAENTKQFTKKLFVSLDGFKAGLLGAFEDLAKKLEEGGLSGLLKNIAGVINGIGMAWMAFDGMFKEGNFKWGQAFKQFENIKKMFKVFSEITKAGGKLKGPIKAIKDLVKGAKLVGKGIADIPKAFKGLKDIGKIGKTIGRGITKGLGKASLKKVPLIGTAMSIWMGIERWKKGDYLGAFLEFGSGVAAAFPGLGTLISIGIDLINLGRDTGFFANIGKSAADAGKATLGNLGENLLMSLPAIGPIYGIAKAIGMFKKGDKVGGFKMIGKSIASILPGGAFIVDFLTNMLNLDKDIKPSNNTGSSSSSGWKWPWQRGGKGFANPVFGKGAVDSSDKELSSTEIGNRLANSSIQTAKSMGGWKSTHYCATGVTNAMQKALGQSIGGHAYQMVDRLKNSAFGKKFFTYKGRANKMTFAPGELPAGTVLGWNRYPGNAYGHIEVSNGKDLLSSDYMRKSTDILGSGYKKYGVKPDIFVPKGAKLSASAMNNITSSPSDGSTYQELDGSESEENIWGDTSTFEGLMDAFNKFNNSLVEGVEPATVTPISSGYDTPTMEDLSAGTPAATTATATTVSAKNSSKPPANSFAPAPQVTKAVNEEADTGSMTTEIRDTDLALLNSILFT